MISSIEKPKLPSRYSYVLNTSELEEILENYSIRTDVNLVYWKPQIVGSILEVNYWLANEHNNFNRLYIRAGAVLKKDIQSAREGLLNEVMPEFIKWIKNIEQLEKSSMLCTKRYLNGYYQNNKVFVIKE